MTEQYQKLKETLAEIFQLDQADLDFGIYRIMNQKRDDINAFLDHKLLQEVKESLAKSSSGDSEELKKKLETMISSLKEAGIDPESNDKVAELKAQYLSTGSPEGLTNEVFSHLTSFFRRYYNQGDFISQRRYKKDVYAIPYEGEEVKLHWANHDQYYIKTGENFKNYSFNLPEGLKVSFVLRDASTEQNNNKSQQGKERRFKLAEEDIFTYENDKGEVTESPELATHLKIWFTYDPQDKKTKQDDLRTAAAKTIKQQLPTQFQSGLLQLKATASNKDRTLLDKHLQDYMAKNSFDYFIHKDLGGFLGRELDFYIKNEILQIDDINLDSPTSFERQLKIVKAFKSIAQKLITLMAQLEEFQKKLWLKKKMVLQSDYCITIDRVPEELYLAILKNQKQIQEWDALFAISEIKKEAKSGLFDQEAIAYSEVFTPDGNLLSGEESKGLNFLKANPFLVLDTQFFTLEWKYKLLSTIEDIDEECNGLMINSENFQGLQFLIKKYKNTVKTIYIDPPYNAQSSEIMYKNTYKHSSWLSLMENRLTISKDILKKDSVMVIAIDEVEQERLGQLISNVFYDYSKDCITIVHNPTGQQGTNFSYTHEYAFFIYPQNGKFIGLEDRTENPDIRPLRNVSKGSHLRTDAANCFYPIYINENGDILGFGDVSEDDFHPTGINVSNQEGLIEIYPIDPQGNERKWVFARDTVESILDELEAKFDLKKKQWDIIRTKRKFNFKSVWTNSKYSANSHGSRIVNEMFGSPIFTFPKSIHTTKDCVDASLLNSNDGLVLDFFSGSGTTGHAVINLNRSDNGSRKYILIEMGEYFNTVTKPRIQKVIYSEDWKDGKPVSRKGSSHFFKYLRLESYEDTLNNLQLKRSNTQQSLLQTDSFGEDYLLHYMLETESRDSLLNLEMFRKPFGYTLKVTENNELKEHEVDLVETFNYLIGLVVQNMEMIRDTVVVQGTNLSGDKILVIWRDVDQMDNAALNEFFRKLQINTKDSEFKRIYVNGDNNLENLRTEDEGWKVVLIEEEFHRRMFEDS